MLEMRSWFSYAPILLPTEEHERSSTDKANAASSAHQFLNGNILIILLQLFCNVAVVTPNLQEKGKRLNFGDITPTFKAYPQHEAQHLFHCGIRVVLLERRGTRDHQNVQKNLV